ncbi:hypothetical protein ES288_A09G023900v1 [Gossypium darwinii]|uniref:Leucine-rich repeat-containing N-terminal plant-type domain-containing protein n=1 Tax=Gossypium darwinii TaxID=34276 RepID=A0A5D2F5I1_GOSDA|nr:hypothetical protein ES288_A09G023900v1 [Gossypium darwinii]
MASPVHFTTFVLFHVLIAVVVAIGPTLGTGSTTLATTSSLEMEAEALLHTGWWHWDVNHTQEHCEWQVNFNDMNGDNLSYFDNVT